MVVREDRTRAAAAIAGFLRGEIDNFALDDATFGGYRGKDETVRYIGYAVWYFYDDLKRHCVSVNKCRWQAMRRCIAFLNTDLELHWGRENIDYSIWPFQSRRDIFAARSRLTNYGLPRFDPAIHSRPIRTKLHTAGLFIPWILLVSSLVGTLLHLCGCF